MYSKAIPFILLLLAGLLIACGAGTPAETPAPTVDLALTAERSTQQAVEAEDTQAAQETAEAVQSAETASAQETLAVQETATAEAAARLATATAQQEAQEARATEIAAEEATKTAATAEVRALATAQAAAMEALVSSLYEEGLITRTEGQYKSIPDFEASWAQLDWYSWNLTGQAPTDFVLNADLAWESASDKANWWTSGCGFAFHIDDDGDHYLIFLGLDGYVNLARNINNRIQVVGRWYAGQMDIPAGTSSLTIAMDGYRISIFVNGERIHSRDDTALPAGDLGFVLVSGTNKDFGTWCQWKDVELWELE